MQRTRTSHGPVVLGLAVAAILALAGCGSSGDDTPAPAAPQPPASAAQDGAAEETSPVAPPPAALDACSLVTKAEAEQLAGTPLDDALPVRETCTYTGPVTGPTAQVEVYVGDGAKKFLDIDRELKHEFVTLSGIGDEAYLEDGAVFINKSGTWVGIRLVLLNDPAENRKPMEDLARKVADRM